MSTTYASRRTKPGLGRLVSYLNGSLESGTFPSSTEPKSSDFFHQREYSPAGMSPSRPQTERVKTIFSPTL